MLAVFTVAMLVAAVGGLYFVAALFGVGDLRQATLLGGGGWLLMWTSLALDSMLSPEHDVQDVDDGVLGGGVLTLVTFLPAAGLAFLTVGVHGHGEVVGWLLAASGAVGVVSFVLYPKVQFGDHLGVGAALGALAVGYLAWTYPGAYAGVLSLAAAVGLLPSAAAVPLWTLRLVGVAVGMGAVLGAYALATSVGLADRLGSALRGLALAPVSLGRSAVSGSGSNSTPTAGPGSDPGAGTGGGDRAREAADLDAGDDDRAMPSGLRDVEDVEAGPYLRLRRGKYGARTIHILTPSGEYAAAESVLGQALREWNRASSDDGVVPVVAWSDDPRPWIAVEAPEGGRLPAVRTDLDFEARVGVVSDAAEALRSAGLYNVRHLDLRPDAVFVDDGRGLVADWGLERALRAADDEPLTPYSAPEQADPDRFGDEGRRTDVYGLAAVTYYALTGDPPVDVPAGADQEALAAAIREGSVAPPSERADCEVPDGVDTVVTAALSTDPEDRYQSPYQYRLELETAAGLT
jgi:hypothetical protein